MVARKEAKHCRKHVVKTAEHLANIGAALRGRIFSDEHKRSLSESRSGGGSKSRTCEWCGQQFSVDKGSSAVRFCSRACGYAQRQGEAAPNWNSAIPTIQCAVCGDVFRLLALSEADSRKTCSYACKNILQRKNQRTKGTNIERAMQAALDRSGLAYIAQHGIARIATVDFFLPTANAVIFCDGDYWHGLPDKIERDARQTMRLEEMGYTVHRFLGSTILKDVDACVLRVREASLSRTSDR